ILLQERKALHGRIGRAIESLFAGRLDEFTGPLAYHFARAEEWPRARAYLLAAGDQAGRIAADAEALSYYGRALRAYEPAAGDGGWPAWQRGRVERKMAEALLRRGQHIEALDYLRRALDHLGEPPLPSSTWGVRRLIAVELLRQLGYRLLPWLSLRRPTRKPAAEIDELARVHFAFGGVAAFMNQERFFATALRGLNLSERLRSAYGISVGSAALGLSADFLAAFKLAGFYHRRALAAARQLENPAAVGFAHSSLAYHAILQADWAGVEANYRLGAAALEEAGDLRYWGFITVFRCFSDMAQGRFAGVAEQAAEMLRRAEASADRQLMAWARLVRGNLQRLQGEFEAAAADLRLALELAQAVPDTPAGCGAACELARALLGLGRPRQALAAIQQAEAIYTAGGAPAPSAWLYRFGRPAVYLALAEGDHNGRSGEWLEIAGTACLDAWRATRTYRGATAEAAVWRGSYLWLSGFPISARRWWRRGLAAAERLGQPYDRAMGLHEIGRHTADAGLLAKARTLFQELGAAAPANG
ncbi:MAG: hypothetical protein ACRDHL_07120, partial [Candidatus Promineifilaceae bacterium]